MTIESSIAFTIAMIILAASPGPGVFATVAQALAGGFRSTLEVIAGIVAGDLVFLLLAVFGLSALARTLGEFFIVIKIAGGCYLIWLGIKMWLAKPAPPEESHGIKNQTGHSGCPLHRFQRIPVRGKKKSVGNRRIFNEADRHA